MNGALKVFRKEAREMFRDRRVVSGAFVMPVLMIFMFVQIFGVISESVRKPQNPKIAVLGSFANKQTEDLVTGRSSGSVSVKTEAEGLDLLKKGKVRMLVEPGTGSTAQGKSAVLTATYDPSEPLSQMAVGTLRESVNGLNKAALKQYFGMVGIPDSTAEPIKLETKEAKLPKGLGGSSFVGMLPYLIVIWAFYGGFSIVGDLVAGEKERGTMETLLVSPVRRRDIALGKYLALTLVCFLSASMSLVAILAVGALKLGVGKALFPTGLSISGPAIGAMLVALIPLVLMFAGLLISVSAYAKNMREAQTYLTLISFVVIMPAVFSQIINLTGMQDAAWVRWTPVLGNSVALREALLGKTQWLGVGQTSLVCLVLAVALFWWTVKLFHRESILART